jgi:hypothetical protein
MLFLFKLFIFILSLIVIFLNGSISVHTSDLSNLNNIFISEIASIGSVKEGNCKQENTTKFNCSSDKWFEIYNNSSESINLRDYSFYIGAGKVEGYFFKFTLDKILASKEFLIIKNKNKDISSVIDSQNKNVVEIGLLQNISKKIDSNTSLTRLRVDKQGKTVINIEVENKCNVSTIEFNFSNNSYSCTEESHLTGFFATPFVLSKSQVNQLKPITNSVENSSITEAKLIEENLNQIIKTEQNLDQLNQNLNIKIETASVTINQAETVKIGEIKKEIREQKITQTKAISNPKIEKNDQKKYKLPSQVIHLENNYQVNSESFNIKQFQKSKQDYHFQAVNPNINQTNIIKTSLLVNLSHSKFIKYLCLDLLFLTMFCLIVSHLQFKDIRNNQLNLFNSQRIRVSYIISLFALFKGLNLTKKLINV